MFGHVYTFKCNNQMRLLYFSWKDMKNPFRTDKSTHLQVIPTLIRWKAPQRLEGDQCCKIDLLEMFFNDDD